MVSSFFSLHYFIFKKILFPSCLVIPGVFLIRILLPCITCLKICIIGKLSNVYSYKRPSNKLKIDIIIVPRGNHSGGEKYGFLCFHFNSCNQTSN